MFCRETAFWPCEDSVYVLFTPIRYAGLSRRYRYQALPLPVSFLSKFGHKTSYGLAGFRKVVFRGRKTLDAERSFRARRSLIK